MQLEFNVLQKALKSTVYTLFRNIEKLFLVQTNYEIQLLYHCD